MRYELQEATWTPETAGSQYAVCAECAPGLSDVGEDLYHDKWGGGGATTCCICGHQNTKGEGWYSTMKQARPVYDWCWDRQTNTPAQRPRGEVTYFRYAKAGSDDRG